MLEIKKNFFAFKMKEGGVFNQGNPPLHRARMMFRTLELFEWETLPHSADSLDIAPSSC